MAVAEILVLLQDGHILAAGASGYPATSGQAKDFASSTDFESGDTRNFNSSTKEHTMKPRERKIAPLGFLLAAVLFIIAALLPLAGRKPLNAAFLGVAVLFGILGGVAWRKAGGEPPPQN